MQFKDLYGHCVVCDDPQDLKNGNQNVVAIPSGSPKAARRECGYFNRYLSSKHENKKRTDSGQQWSSGISLPPL